MKGYIKTQVGNVSIDTEVIAQYAGSVAVECFGIVGMASVNVTDGIVKLLVWRHSDAVERTLRAPFDDSVEAEVQNANGAPAKGALAKMKKERRKFIPHSPTKGVDFGVIVSWDAAKNMTSYDGSDYVAESTPLADTKEEMLIPSKYA